MFSISGFMSIVMALIVLFWLVVIGVIVFVVVYLVRFGERQKRETTEEGDSPMQILKERYAKDEISKEEFEEKKKELQKTENGQ